MNQKAKATILTSLNLAVQTAMGMSATTSIAHTQAAAQEQLPLAQQNKVIQANTNEFEASFLKVSNSCKVSHAAFDAVYVGLENISQEVIGVHAEIEMA